MNASKQDQATESLNGGHFSEEVNVELRMECERLRVEVAQLRAERDVYLKALYALTDEPTDFDKDAILAQVGKGIPLREFVEKLEARGT